MKKLIFIIFLIFIFNNTLLGQNFTYEFHGIVEEQNIPLGNVTIRAYQGQQLVINQATLENGYYQLKLSFNTNYFLEFSKQGYKPKRFFISTETNNEITDNLKSDFYTINLEQGKSTGDENVTFLQIQSSSGNLLSAGNEFVNDKIIQAEKRANEIIAIAHFEADSIVNYAKTVEKDIIDNYQNYQINKDSLIKNRDNIFDEYIADNADIIPKDTYSTNDSLLAIQDLIEKGYENIDEVKKQLLEAQNANDTTKILELQNEYDKLMSLTNAYEEQAKWYQTQIDIKDLKIEKKKNTVTFLFIASLLFIMILLILVILFRNKRRANILINDKNIKLEKTNTKISEQKSKLETANTIISKKNNDLEIQKEEIQEQHSQITSSIKYAKNIQTAVLPFLTNFKKEFDTFVIFKPKDIVSGDFYWNQDLKGGNYETIITVIDCTGHGVSGAFMSMISYSLLNYIVKELKIFEPEKILERLDKEVVVSLRQEKTNNMDGMDMCICKIIKENDKTTIYFSGARRPIFRYNSSTNEIETIKGTRRSIGGNRIVRNIPDFELKTFEINKNDSIYLTSDGYIDQSNEQRKRFGSQAFTNVLEQIKDKTMTDQKDILLEELQKHQGTSAQRDDITMIGIKF